MNICIYAMRSGLGDNGGSRTVLLSVQALRRLGHKCSVIATIDNFTYFAHDRCLDSIPPDTDALIAASWYDVGQMHKVWGGVSAWWMRLWDSHKLSEDDICRLAEKQPMLVNGEFMQSRLALHGINSEIVYQGVDFDKWHPDGTKRHSGLIGSLLRKEPRYNSDEFKRLSEMLHDKYKFTGIYKTEHLREWYQSLEYYFAPQRLGGLSNPPMEAALCGAVLVCPRFEESGLADYANDETAIIYDDMNNLPAMLDGDHTDKTDSINILLRDKIKSREENMQLLANFLAKQ